MSSHVQHTMLAVRVFVQAARTVGLWLAGSECKDVLCSKPTDPDRIVVSQPT